MNFTEFSKYVATKVADSWVSMSMFVSGVLHLVDKECHTTLFIKEKDIYYLMTLPKNIKRKISRKEQKSLRGRRPVMEAFVVLDLVDKGILNSRKKISVKVLVMFWILSLTKI